MDVIQDAAAGSFGDVLTTAQTGLIASSLLAAQQQQQRHANMLVFGVGYDSEAWTRVNCGGRTAFVENNAAWLEKITASHPHLQVSKVTYKASARHTGDFYANPWLMELPDSITGTCWDTILIDSPAG